MINILCTLEKTVGWIGRKPHNVLMGFRHKYPEFYHRHIQVYGSIPVMTDTHTDMDYRES